METKGSIGSDVGRVKEQLDLLDQVFPGGIPATESLVRSRLRDLDDSDLRDRALDAFQTLSSDFGLDTLRAVPSQAKRDPVARRVKLMDVEDNMDLRRLAEVQQKDLDRMRRYHAAWLELVSPASDSPVEEADK